MQTFATRFTSITTLYDQVLLSRHAHRAELRVGKRPGGGGGEWRLGSGQGSSAGDSTIIIDREDLKDRDTHLV